MPLQDFVRRLEYEAQQVAFALSAERSSYESANDAAISDRQRDQIRRLLLRVRELEQDDGVQRVTSRRVDDDAATVALDESLTSAGVNTACCQWRRRNQQSE